MIRFPKLHIATSVINRILNAADGVGAFNPINAPSMPEQNPNGPLLDQQLNTPPSGAAPEPSVIADTIGNERSPLESITQE